MSGFTKLFGSILASTIWQESNETRLVWITMLAMANQHGEVEASIPGLAKMANVSLAATEEALKQLMSPDLYSRTKDHEGRRILEIDGGWVILNHAKYRGKLSEEYKKEQAAKRQREFRSRGQMKRLVGPAVSATYKNRERRFVAAEKAGDSALADRVASEGLPEENGAQIES